MMPKSTKQVKPLWWDVEHNEGVGVGHLFVVHKIQEDQYSKTVTLKHQDKELAKIFMDEGVSCEVLIEQTLEMYKQRVKEAINKHTDIGHHHSDEPCECTSCRLIQELGL